MKEGDGGLSFFSSMALTSVSEVNNNRLPLAVNFEVIGTKMIGITQPVL